jgi:hypothetical protein
MNSSIIKMFGPSISDPSKIVNRDVPACDEHAYVRAGYKRGSIPEAGAMPEAPKASVAKAPSLGSEELPMEADAEPVAEQPAKSRKKKGQN